MGTIIEATATATAQQRSMAPGALEAVDAAARTCLERADRTAGELDLLINAGVYHDRILSEPAFASLIQEDIGANPRHPPGAGHGTFSFDVSNGACGLLTGIHLVDGMLASGTAKLGMVVASDMDPEPGVSRGFGFPAVGGAVLLSADASRAGFTAFHFATFPQFAELFQGYVDWQEMPGAGRHLTAGTSSPSRSPSPTPRGRSSAPSRPPANWRRRRRSTSPRSTSSSPPRRSRASATHWRGDSACLPSGSRRPRMTSHSRTRPRRWWRWTPSDSRRRARHCSSRWARASQSRPRSTGHDLSVRRQRAQHADVARLRALLAPVESGVPRIAPARTRELRPLARIVAELAGRVSDNGPPNIFTTLGQHPRLFRAWLRYSAHLMPFGQLPRRDTELVILRVAWQCRSPYEWQQHVPIALRVGLTPDEVAGVADGSGAGTLHRASAGAAGRQRRAAGAARALGRDVERRPGESPRSRGDRAVHAHRALPRPGVHDRRTRHPTRPGPGRAELTWPRPLSPGRRARPTPPRTRASRFPRARRSARW